jgi:hypothetical protein
VTIAYNDGGIDGAGAELVNTIVAFSRSGALECEVPVVSLGHNIDSGRSCRMGATGDQSRIRGELLEPLAENGGPTPTHAPYSWSAAIDRGDDAACPDVDQRGMPRPVGAHCDVGAVEL